MTIFNNYYRRLLASLVRGDTFEAQDAPNVQERQFPAHSILRVLSSGDKAGSLGRCSIKIGYGPSSTPRPAHRQGLLEVVRHVTNFAEDFVEKSKIYHSSLFQHRREQPNLVSLKSYPFSILSEVTSWISSLQSQTT